MKFQTPAPRGGVPLSPGDTALSQPGSSFKPLRLGAVFLCCCPALRHARSGHVSNPCASGRCSSEGSPSHRMVGHSGSFKPLRLGAVFLCQPTPTNQPLPTSVSNPCASGRCSSVSVFRAGRFGGITFQTPAPRGGVPLKTCSSTEQARRASFKPLRLGAVFL